MSHTISEMAWSYSSDPMYDVYFDIYYEIIFQESLA